MSNFWKDLPKPFFILAPMEAVTDVVFRHVIRKAGAPDIFFTEFTNATGWVHAGDKAVAGRLVKTKDEYPLVAQIWGGEPGDMESFAKHCAKLGFDGIDINMGCPAKSAIKSGGSALILKPDIAVASITAAKSAGLPVSVKTRLGYTRVDEWREWIATLLQQDIVALTIHLRTKKEMSKVPAHHELIPEIKRLRDEIAPQALLIINGDIRDRQHGLELTEEHGIDGIMIGRGIFQNPFAFLQEGENEGNAKRSASFSGDSVFPTERGKANNQLAPSESSENESTEPASYAVNDGNKKLLLFDLLNYHLDMFDQYQAQLKRPFETLKRFFKIYIRDFDGASELRDKLMQTKSTDEVRNALEEYS